MKKTKKEAEPRYALSLTRKQLQLLSVACERMSRNLCGQLDMGVFYELERAINRHHEGEERMDLLSEVRQTLDVLRTRCWNLDSRQFYGIHYDKDSDILFDIHQVLRHQLWLEDPNRSNAVVMSSVHKFASEPLVTIRKEDNDGTADL